MDEVLHFGLQAKPLELDCDQFVSAHPWAVSFTGQLFLFGEQQKNDKTYNPSELRITKISNFKNLAKNFLMRE